MSAYITNEPFILREKGYHEQIFHQKIMDLIFMKILFLLQKSLQMLIQLL